VTTDARRAYREWELDGATPEPPAFSINPDWMVDETREGERVSVWEDAAAYVEAVKNSYRRDNWQDQPVHCEVWSEKATILSSLRPVKDDWGITLRVSHGFGSTGMESDIGYLFEGIDKEIIVFFLGDHDPSGRVIEEDIHRRAMQAAGRDFEMERLAIHPEDITRYNLPPQRIKGTDSRAADFRRRYGSDAATVELDALPADVLRQRVEDAVKELIDFEAWERQLMVQAAELASIREFADRINGLTRSEGR
jgi:hypothetical protein